MKNNNCVIYLGIAVVGLSLAQASARPVNRLPNPSFEKKTGNEVHGWTSRAWAGEANARWSVASPGRTGKQCLSIR